jgi:DNA polymerase-3 subunit epsilon
LLADVYIGMTRGQDALLIDLGAGSSSATPGQIVDLSQFQLPVIQPNDAEADQHEAVLAQMDKSSGGKVVFRRAADMA